MLCEGKEQEEPGELREGNSNRFRRVGRGRETLGKRLARMITESTSSDITAVTEQTELEEPEAFPGSNVNFTVDKEEGAQEVKRHSDGPGQLSL